MRAVRSVICRSISDKPLGMGDEFFVDGLHPLLGQRAGVFDALGTVRIGSGVHYATRPVPVVPARNLLLGWIVGILWFLFRVEVIEVPEELIEAAVGG